MIVQVDTSLAGIAELLAAMVRINYLDAKADPELAADLVRRCKAGPGQGFVYELDGFRDTWSTFARLPWRKPAPIKADCEDQSAAYLAALALTDEDLELEAAITQPKAPGMAHAYGRLRKRGSFSPLKPLDPCVYNGMPRPPDSFYSDHPESSGRSAFVRIF